MLFWWHISYCLCQQIYWTNDYRLCNLTFTTEWVHIISSLAHCKYYNLTRGLLVDCRNKIYPICDCQSLMSVFPKWVRGQPWGWELSNKHFWAISVKHCLTALYLLAHLILTASLSSRVISTSISILQMKTPTDTCWGRIQAQVCWLSVFLSYAVMPLMWKGGMKRKSKTEWSVRRSWKQMKTSITESTQMKPQRAPWRGQRKLKGKH